MSTQSKQLHPKHITPQQQAIIRGAWVIDKELRDKLDHFFLVHDTWINLEADFYVDHQEVKRFLRHEGKEYEVVLCAPVRQLMAAEELGLSFRVHRATDIRVVLINQWYATDKKNPSTDVDSVEA